MYSVVAYGIMATDGVRMDAYERAIAKAVKPGDVVVDIGCGPGIFSLLALRAGAARVHAIDTDSTVWLARDLLAENGFGDKLVVHQKSSFDVDIGEKADVVIADLRGSFTLFEQNVASLADARTRFLAPGGRMVPTRDRLFVTLIESERFRRHIELGWTSLERRGFSGKAARVATLNSIYSDSEVMVLADQALSDSKPWAEIRYGEPVVRSFDATVDLSMTRGGTAHALALWFQASLFDDIGFDNAPGKQLVYRRTILPLAEPVRVEAGESARVTLRADVTGSQWAWDTAIGDRARFRQATFLGRPTSPEALLRESMEATPSRSHEGERASRILTMMDGATKLDAIVEAIAASEPQARREAIIDDVRGCARRYSR